MIENPMMKAYGDKETNIHYILRPGVYGLAFNLKGEVAVVKVPFGYHLPGGGIETGEDHVACLKREFLEETGYSIRIENFFEMSKQYTFSERSGNHYELVGHFYKVKLLEKKREPIEADHALLWLSKEEALKKLSLEYQVEAVKHAFD